jgi:FMN phosphatase YigB (HAD superfamily)
MALLVKWMGVDFGECLMDATMRRSHLVISDTSKELGEPELSEERFHRWRVAEEKYGSLYIIMECHKPEVINYVFNDHPRAAEIFLDVEQKYMKLADGARDALIYLIEQGIALSVVTAAKSNLGPIETSTEMRFLRNQKLLEYFDELISPQGKVNMHDNSIDIRYQGTSKEEGTLYDVLVEDLARRGIKPSEAVMMGDKEWADITPAKKRGLKTILYAGYVCRGPSEADIVIHHFSELKEIIRSGSH